MRSALGSRRIAWLAVPAVLSLLASCSHVIGVMDGLGAAMRTVSEPPETTSHTITEKGLFEVELEVIKPMLVNVGFVGTQPGGGVLAGEPSKYIGGGTLILLKDFANRGNYLKVAVPPKCVGGC